jgi:hypothetical protein
MKAKLIRWFISDETTRILEDAIARMDEILNEHNANK